MESKIFVEYGMVWNRKKSMESTLLCKLLEPIDAASRNMCEDSASISLQIPISSLLITKLEQVTEEVLLPMKESILRVLKEKFSVDQERYY